jgi:raffinose/stachyose/melibiose transport system permease protein
VWAGSDGEGAWRTGRGGDAAASDTGARSGFATLSCDILDDPYRPGGCAAAEAPHGPPRVLRHGHPQGIYYSFTDSPGYGPSSFVGLRNYIALLTDDRVIHAYWFTFLIAGVATVLVNVVALAIAVALNGHIKFKNSLRGVYFIPNVLGILVVGYIFNYLFSNSLPALGSNLGIDALATSLLGKASTAWIAIVILAVWQAAAFNIMIYIAGLQTVPEEVYEAASIDGAGAWKKFSSITFPLIAGFFTINMVLSLKSMLQIFDHIVALTAADREPTPSQLPCSSTRAASRAESTATRAPTRWSSSSSS